MTEGQERALASMTIAYPGAITLTGDRVHDIQVCDSLVALGHAVRIESGDFEGVGFGLSPQFAEAHRRVIQQRADEAGQN